MMNVVEANDVEHWCAVFLEELSGKSASVVPPLAEGDTWGREGSTLASATAGH